MVMTSLCCSVCVGPGLASVVCRHVLKPQLIVATDGDAGSIELTNYNILLNDECNAGVVRSSVNVSEESVNYESVIDGTVSAKPVHMVRPVPPLSTTNNILPMQLYWGNSEHIAAAIALLDHPSISVSSSSATSTISSTGDSLCDHANVASVSEPVQRLGYDVVFMSDIVALVYTDAFDSLLTTMKQLCKPSTVLYLVYKRRHSSEAQFFEKLEASKLFDICKLPRSTIHVDFQHLPIFIYRLTPRWL